MTDEPDAKEPSRDFEFSDHDIKAMKKIARMRLKDQAAEAREQLAALERIAGIVEFDLFSWAQTAK